MYCNLFNKARSNVGEAKAEKLQHKVTNICIGCLKYMPLEQMHPSINGHICYNVCSTKNCIIWAVYFKNT